MYCKHCGKEIKEGVKFCKYCGESLAISPETVETTTEIVYGGFWIRLGAFLFDYVLIFALSFILGFILLFLGFFWVGLTDWAETIFGLAILIIYHTFFLSIFSATPGKLVFGLRVVDDAKKEKLSFVKALIRSLSYIVSSFLFGLGFLMIAFDKPKHQGWHDKIAKTLVLREKKRNLALVIVLSIISVILSVAIIWYAYSGTEYDYFFEDFLTKTESGVIYAEIQKALERQPSNFQSLFDKESFIDLKEIPIRTATGEKKTAEQIFEKYSEAIITIGIKDWYGDFGFGSGFLISPTGLIVTNYHVIEDADKAIVALINKHKRVDTYNITSVVATDSIKDIAILKIKGQGLPYVTIGDSDLAKPGQKVFAIGNPEGYTNTISDGIISQIREFEKGIKSFQITAPISMGSSGGVLFNEMGEVIGITNMIDWYGQNINFAVPINYVKELIGLKDGAFESISEEASDLIFCNGQYWQPCPIGQKFHCPQIGNPFCCDTGLICNDQCWDFCPSGQKFYCPPKGDPYCQ